eukprot:CAMPEP_0172596862 /NCGR_PEP_ID=MMETSP1068-20121228/16740_1 /TAXON_ID=35684 /ORGANISM="Pseudopedinella elastica, Strain CCMP716" /LENGTH=249 /DNA_ID=CAMNT_0013396097 /DNA_START=86 /DNA_END=835 /DNA_ORIENTATION=-
MGAGASIPETIPESEETALQAGFTQEQIDAYKASHATADSAPAEAAPAATELEATPEEAAKAALAIQNQMRVKEAKAAVAEQRVVNSIGNDIATKVTVEVQKRLNSFEFTQMCQEEFKKADANGDGALVVTELLPAMNAIKEREAPGPTIPLETADAALAEFDTDKSGAIEYEEFPMLVKVLILALNIDRHVVEVGKYWLAAEAARKDLEASGKGFEGTMPAKPRALSPKAPLVAMESMEEEEEEEEDA